MCVYLRTVVINKGPGWVERGRMSKELHNVLLHSKLIKGAGYPYYSRNKTPQLPGALT